MSAKFWIRYLVLCALGITWIARADTETTGGARVFENPTSNGDMKFRVNVGGTKTDGIKITGSSAAVDIVGNLTQTLGSPVYTLQSTGGAGNAQNIKFLNAGASGHFNFIIGHDQNVNDTLEITPSTATDGTTFTTPSLQVNTTGIKLPSGSSPTTLTIYSESTTTPTISGFTTTPTVTVKATRIGHLVTLNVTASGKLTKDGSNGGVGFTVPSDFGCADGWVVQSMTVANVQTSVLWRANGTTVQGFSNLAGSNIGANSTNVGWEVPLDFACNI